MSAENSETILKHLMSEATTVLQQEECVSLFDEENFYPENTKITYSSTTNTSPVFYLESPPETKIGYYPSKKIFVVKGKPIIEACGVDSFDRSYGKKVEEYNEIDGDTFKFDLDSLEDSNTDFTIGEKHYNSLKDFASQDNESLRVRLLGINAPEVVHYTAIPVLKTELESYKVTKKYKEIKNNGDYLCASKNRKDDELITFYACDEGFYEIINEDDDTYRNFISNLDSSDTTLLDKTSFVKIVSVNSTLDKSQEYIDEGEKAKKIAIDLLSKASDIIIVLDHQTLNRKDSTLPNSYHDAIYLSENSVLKRVFTYIESRWNELFGLKRYKYMGFNAPGLDNNGRFLGAVYVKCDITTDGHSAPTEQWVNLAKYIIYNCRDFTESLPSYNNPLEEYHNNFVSSSFNLPSYDIDSIEILNRFERYTDDMINDRNQFYETITGKSMDFLKDYTLIIGDCVLIVPPISIKQLSQTSHKKVHLMRAKGAAIKSLPKSSKIIELNLYFNEDDSINGKPITQTLNGKQVVYYMNSLRSLLAMFRLTPFLPIENTYINDVLGVDAVTLSNIEVATVQNYPKTLRAILTLREFNYGIYMPEIQESEDLTTNAFSRTIHYPVMRWYYQKVLQRGNEIKDLDFNSDEYITATYGNNTSLVPMSFNNASIEFYIPDETQLQKRMQALKDYIPIITQEDLTENMKNGIKEALKIKDAINNLLKDNELFSKIEQLKEPEIIHLDYEIPSAPFEWSPEVLTRDPTMFLVVRTTANEKIETGIIWPGSCITSFQKSFLCLKDYSYLVKGLQLPDVALQYKLPDSYQNYTGNKVSDICRLIQSHLNMFGNIQIEEYVDCTNLTDQKLVWKVLIPLPHSLRSSEYETTLLLKKVTNDFGLKDNEELLSFNNEGILCIPLLFEFPLVSYTSLSPVPTECFTGPLENLCRVNGNFTFDYDCNGFQFLYYLDNMASGTENVGDDSLQLQRELLKEANDSLLNASLGLKFNKYNIGNAIVESIACSYSNTFSQTSLKALDGYAFQYCGGQEIAIEINIITQDDLTVSMLTELPKYSAYFVRHYNLVLNCWPLRLNSELTKFFGVNEVLVESVQTTTVENQPGVTRISVRLFSVDRTTRAKEIIKKLDNVANNSGNISIGNEAKLNIKTFFDLKESLSQIELYPDLELPTIEDLKASGFLIGDYHNNDRVYVDPDFYFMYGETLSSEIIRESIIQGLKTNVSNIQYEVSDHNGALVKFGIPTLKDLLKDKKDIENINDLAQIESDLYTEDAQITYDYTDLRKEVLSQLDERAQIRYILSDTMAMLNTPIWNISSTIKCPFRELQYTMLKNIKDTDVGKQIDSIIQEVNTKIDNVINEGINEKQMKDEIAPNSKLDSMKDLSEWAASQIINTVDSVQKDIDFRFILDCNNGKEKNVNYQNLQKCILAAADAYTGDSNYTSTFIDLQNISGKDDVFTEIAWTVRPYLNYGENLTNKDGKVDVENNLIPYCRILKNGTEYFASNIEDGIKNGITFGVFQIGRYNRKFISDYTGADINTMKEDEKYFIDPYYRQAQIDGDIETVNRYKRLLLTSPSYSTIAYIRQLLVIYKHLVNQNILLSVYELARNEADNEIKSHLAKDAMNPSTDLDTDDQADVDSENAKKDILEDFYTLTSLLVNYQKVDSDKRNTIIKEVLKLDEKSKLASALKKDMKLSTDSGVPTEITEFMDKCSKEMNNDDNSEETKQRYKMLYQAANTNQDVLSFAYQIYSLEAAYKVSVGISKESYESVRDLITNDWENIVSGKLIALSLYLMDYDNLYTRVQKKNVTELNRIIMSVSYPSIENQYSIVRKYLLALTGRGLLELSELNTSYETAENLYKNVINETLAIDRSKNPQEYLRDACYDMIKNDHRGKMLRAFPTYYMLFIDEGREYGLWKLHDNFYSMNAICSLTVAKSRKIAADTAHIVMSNMFRNYTQPDYDTLYNLDTKTLNEIRYSIQDVWNSIFSPRSYYEKSELQRQNTVENLFHTALVPGARIHIRMGYGADASSLPIVFNGTIAEVQDGELIEVIAQGDGSELTNTIVDNESLEDVQNNDALPIGHELANWWTNGVTPKTALVSLLNTKGQWLHNTIREITKGRFFNYNPYGIAHFGDPDFKAIFKNGETSQNIFEAYKDAIWTNNGTSTQLASQYRTEDIPRISMYVEGKTFWDILHVCRSTCPDYMCSIIPFQLRSSIFMGAGRYYYAFDYVQEKEKDSETTIIKEKRKPFQQYHYYTSYTDIIENVITTDASRIKTVATGYYTETKLFGKEVSKKVGPLYIDYDIYPEFQKSTVVDTQLWAKGVPVLGTMLGIISDTSDKTGESLPGAKEIAWRMTASALKESVKDMYDGELIIMGDPSIKPYDRVWIEDIIKNMQGQFEVEAVTLSMNAETGFTTSIIPDCISCVDDRYERYNELCFRPIISSIAMSFVPKFLLSRFIFGENYKTFMKVASKLVSKGGVAASTYLSDIAKILGKDSVTLKSDILTNTSNISNALYSGLNGTDYYDLITNTIKKAGTRLVTLDKDASPEQLIKFLETNGNALSQTDADSLKETLIKVGKQKNTDSSSYIADISEDLKNYQNGVNASISSSIKFNDDFYTTLDQLADVMLQSDEVDDTILNAAQCLKNMSQKKTIENATDLSEMANALKKAKKVAEYTDEFEALATAANAIDDITPIVKSVNKIDDIKKLSTAINVIMAGTGPIGWLSALIKFVGEMAISATIGLYATEYIERYLQNLQVLQIYPLVKNGYVMTAGIAGHKGLCVGSLTENSQGAWTTFVTDLFGAKEPSGFITTFVQTFFTSDKAKKIASQYRTNNQLPDPTSSNFDREAMMTQITSDINKTYAKYSLKNEQFLYKTKRVQDLNKVTSTMKTLLIQDDFNGNKLSADTCDVLIPLVCDPTLSFLIDEGYLKIFAQLKPDGTICGNFFGEPKTLSYLKKDEQVNVPALRSEALIVFKDICAKFIYLMEYNKNTEDGEAKVKECNLNFTSGTIINDQDHYEGTGYAFRFAILNDDGYSDQIMEEMNTLYNYNEDNKTIYYQKEKTTGEYYVVVLPVEQESEK